MLVDTYVEGNVSIYYNYYTTSVLYQLREHYMTYFKSLDKPIRVEISTSVCTKVPKTEDCYRIYYNLEHLESSQDPQSPMFDSGYFDYLSIMDEIWEFDLKNVRRYPQVLLSKVRFMPLRYTTYLDRYFNPNPVKYFDLCFIGNLYRRTEVLERITHHNHLMSICMVSGPKLSWEYPVLFNSKYGLDLHNYRVIGQNQVRISELIQLGVLVVTQPSDFNYYEDLVVEWNFDSTQNLELFAQQIDTPRDPSYIRSRFKELTYNDVDYNNWCQSLYDRYVATH